MGLLYRRDRALTLSGLAVSAIGLAAYEWLMAPIVHYGRICGHAPTELHCPACYAALAMMAGGLVAALAPTARVRLRAARAR